MSRLTLGDASYVTLAGGAALDSVHNDPGAIRLLAGGTVSGLGLAVDHHRGLKLAAVGTVVGAAIRVWTTIIGHWLAIGRLVVAAVRGRVGVGRRIGVNRTVRIGIVVVRSGTEAERECRAAAMYLRPRRSLNSTRESILQLRSDRRAVLCPHADESAPAVVNVA